MQWTLTKRTSSLSLASFLLGMALFLTVTNGQIVLPQALLLGTPQTLDVSICSAYYMEINFKKLSFSVLDYVGIAGILFTRKKIYQPCTGDLYAACLAIGSEYCSYRSLQGTTNEIIYEELGACDDIVYVYLQPNFGSLDRNSITVNTTLIDQPCKKYEQQNSFELCGGTDISICRYGCSEMCIWTSCLVDVLSPSKVPVATEMFSMCLPRNLTEDEYKSRCALVLPNQPTLKPDRKDSCESKPIEEPSSGISWIWIVIIIIVLGVGGASAYYQYSLRHSPTPPFTPPSFCPECLFPKPDSYVRMDR